MSLKQIIVDFLMFLAGLILDKKETAQHKEQINNNVKIVVSEKPYRYMTDDVKKFITCDLSQNDALRIYTDITIYETAKISPYRLIAPESKKYFVITDGQITESGVLE